MCDIVYHYTSPDGILGILKNKTLRFTDCQYLNDKGEFVYIRVPFEKAYKKIIQERGESDENLDGFIDEFFISPYVYLSFKNNVNKNSSSKKFSIGYNRYYVLCTSINPDTANMWNYYVKNGIYQGYNLGIDRNFINERFSNCRNNEIEFIDGKVIYDEKEQIKMIYTKLKELLAQFDERKRLIDDDDDYSHEMNIQDFQENLYGYIHEQKLFFKNPAFLGEEEYRFILKVDNEFSGDNKLSIDFRVGESGIITPYIEWKYTLSEKENLFKQITLAPMIESNLAEESFKRFLANTVHKKIEIKQSSIKLRF